MRRNRHRADAIGWSGLLIFNDATKSKNIISDRLRPRIKKMDFLQKLLILPHKMRRNEHRADGIRW